MAHTGLLLVLLVASPPVDDLGVEDFAPAVSWITGDWEVHPEGDCELPAELALLFGLDLEDGRIGRVLDEFRLDVPELFGITPPPRGAVRFPGEFEAMETLYLAYAGLPDYDRVYADIIASAVGEGEIRILVTPWDRPMLDALLESSGVSPRRVTYVEDVPFDTVWIRDYGPQPVVADGRLAFVDPRYFSNCLYNDALPTNLASILGFLPVFRPPLWLEGGDLLSDGNGTCFTTTYTVTENGLTDEILGDLLRAYYGCEVTHVLSPMVGDVIEHLDMFFYVADEDVLLLGQSTPEHDPDNHAILEENLALLASINTRDGRPYTIVRVPMPEPLVPGEDETDEPLVLTYLNMLAFNRVVLVPVYGSSRGAEQRALDAIASAFPGRRVVPIDADALASDYGTIHCITRTLPAFDDESARRRAVRGGGSR